MFVLVVHMLLLFPRVLPLARSAPGPAGLRGPADLYRAQHSNLNWALVGVMGGHRLTGATDGRRAPSWTWGGSMAPL